MSLKGNKGEWSELYAFFKLLDDARLVSADQNLNKTSSFLSIDSIYRDDSGKLLCFKINNNIVQVIDVKSGRLVSSFSQLDANNIAKELLLEIQKLKGSCINSKTESKIKKYHINQVKTKSQSKGDIKMLVYDNTHGISSEQDFSIKSFLGSKPTLFNAHKTTNIIYKISDNNGNPITPSDLSIVNNNGNPRKYIKRVKKLMALGYNIEFDSYQDEIFDLNLQLIDRDLPEILACIILDKYVNQVVNIEDIIKKLNVDNPLNYNLSYGHNFYEFKLVNFLVEAALGMTSKTVWTGNYAVIGGIIIVKPDAEILCYHLVDFNKFKEYLKKTCKLDNPSGSKMGYGSVYLENNQSYIKLNFQIKA